VKFVERLVSILKVADLTQENVSCLNTSLVILMLSARENRLPLMLSSLGMLVTYRYRRAKMFQSKMG
jgi:Trpc4-associated protein